LDWITVVSAASCRTGKDSVGSKLHSPWPLETAVCESLTGDEFLARGDPLPEAEWDGDCDGDAIIEPPTVVVDETMAKPDTLREGSFSPRRAFCTAWFRAGVRDRRLSSEMALGRARTMQLVVGSGTWMGIPPSWTVKPAPSPRSRSAWLAAWVAANKISRESTTPNLTDRRKD